MELSYNVFKDFPEIRYGMSAKEHGFMNIRPTDNPQFNEQASTNRLAYLTECTGVTEGDRVFLPYLQHGKDIYIVSHNNYHWNKKVDGAITEERNTFICVENGDCPTILVAARKSSGQPVIAIAHSGREGTRKNIMAQIIGACKSIYDCLLTQIYIAVSPGIQAHHYVVDRETAMGFGDRYTGYTHKCPGGYQLDLPGIIRQQAIYLGVPQNHIALSPECTFCHGNGKAFFSHRRDRVDPPRTSLSYIVIRPPLQ